MRLPESAMLLGLGVQPSARLAFVVLLRQVPHRTREVRPEAVLGCLHELPRKDRRQVQRGRRGHLLHVRYLETFGTPLALAVLHAACSASDRIPSHGDSDASSGGAAGADASPGPCGALMFQSGSICIDKQPALHVDGSQGSAVSFTEAVTICEARGARLCTEAEREAACPNGQYSQDPTGKEVYCSGPAATWEWSSSASCSDGRCLSPCCNSATNPCQCGQPVGQLQSYRCCRSL